MDQHRAELMAVFLAEADEQLQLLEQEIMKLEQTGGSPKGIQSLFRVAHTLKGSSAAMGFEELKRLTHEMENVLDKLRHDELKVSERVIGLLFECSDQLRLLVEDIEGGRKEPRELDTLVTKLQALEQGDGLGTAGVVGLPDEPPESTDLECWVKLEAGSGNRYICDVVLSPECDIKAARAYILKQELASIGKVAASYPDMERNKKAEVSGEVRYWFWSDEDITVVESLCHCWLQSGQVTRISMIRAGGEPLFTLGGQPVEEKEKQSDKDATPAAGGRGHDEVRRSAQTVRVDVERLELLMNLVGELVIDQTRIAQVGTVLRDGYSDDAVNDLEQISNHISRVVGELQESVMKTRMLPIEQLFNRFPRMVRDLAQTLKKDINLTITGKETELDRTVIEEIGDPLIHLLRNAVDHGIEPAEARIKAGKPSKGNIHIKAHHQENQVVLIIEDDGAGINGEKLKQSAVRKGLISVQEAESLTEQEMIQLIFLPGFSTANKVSDVSGRGVGMDIVRSHIEKLNGLIEVETELGKGTRFIIKLPLTLAILRGLLIKLLHTTYALPMSSVIEIVRLDRKEIQSIKGQTVIKIRDKILPLVWLHDHFQLQRDDRKRANIFIVIVGIAEKRVGLIVDELMGNQEIVVKSIGSYVGKIEGISGATILGDGSVSLILDVAGIFKLVERDRTAYKEDWEAVI